MEYYYRDDTPGCGFFILLAIVFIIVFIYALPSKEENPFFASSASDRSTATEAQSTSQGSKTQAKTYYVEIIGNVNLREKIGTDTKILVVIPKGMKLECTAKETTSGGYVWYKTTYKKQTGWIYGEYAKEISP